VTPAPRLKYLGGTGKVMGLTAMIRLLPFTNEEISKKDCSERNLHVEESKGGEGGLQQMFDEKIRATFASLGFLGEYSARTLSY
jgi:hypothetical protein